jgi:hypothetical protein
MKPGFKTIVLALVVTLLCVPAAFAKNGNGHGKPSWAGGGGGNGHGKPAWAGQGKGHADKQKSKHEKKNKHEQARAEDAAQDEEINLDDLNPAWYCFTLESMMDAADADAVAGGAEAGEFSSFDTEFGTNDKKRNSHGACVSRRAHGEDLSGALDEASTEPDCEPAADADDEGAAEEGAEDEGAAEDEAPEQTDDTEAPASDEAPGDEQGDEADDTTDEADDTTDEADDTTDEAPDDPEDCESEASDDEASDDEASDNQEGDVETAAFARALVSFIKL